jgi:hypothetical protein
MSIAFVDHLKIIIRKELFFYEDDFYLYKFESVHPLGFS